MQNEDATILQELVFNQGHIKGTSHTKCLLSLMSFIKVDTSPRIKTLLK